MTTNPRMILALDRARLVAEQARIVANALRDSEVSDRMLTENHRSAEGDPIRMRNIPVTALGVAAVQPGTQPLQALLATEARRLRHAS